jgi:Ni/Co efflux regulator RcnB
MKNEETHMKKLVLGTFALALLTPCAAFAQRSDSSPRNAESRRAVWIEGGVVPDDLRVGGKNVHTDWRGAGLRPPPEGFAWLHLGDSYVLTDQKSGRILNVETVFGYDKYDAKRP